MKILICGDIHMCRNSSILRRAGKKYTIRLENCIKSINWVEEIAKKYNCEQEIFLGDFFDSYTLDDETITAVKEIKWNNLPKVAIVGNHESSRTSLEYSSLKLLEDKNFEVIYKATKKKFGNIEFCLLPYVTERDRKTLAEYFGDKTGKRVICSHIDLAGINYGPIITKTGFPIKEIEDNAEIIFNGHIHQFSKLSEKLIILGILTGKDMGENAKLYPHYIAVLDTDTLKYELIENPYAFNFYKFEINKEADLEELNDLKNNAVLSIKCNEKLINALSEKLDGLKNKIVETRIITVHDLVDIAESDTADLVVDYIGKFIECARTNIEHTKLLDEELAEICK